MITEVKIWPLKKEHPRIKANASFVLGEAFRIKCTIFKGDKGLWVGLPGRYVDDKENPGQKKWFNDVDCISKEARKQLNDAVLNKYNEEIGGTPTPQGSAEGPSDQTKQNVPFG